MFNTENASQLVVILLGSAVFGTLISNLYSTRLKRKELLSAAIKSALRRVEMYYRVLRRTADETDHVKIRNIFHEVQEENDYYKALLSLESVWLGELYGRFIEALKRETMRKIQAAWDEDNFGPGARLEKVDHPDVKLFVGQFTKDSRRLFNPLMRIYMRVKHAVRKHIKEDGYGSR